MRKEQILDSGENCRRDGSRNEFQAAGPATGTARTEVLWSFFLPHRVQSLYRLFHVANRPSLSIYVTACAVFLCNLHALMWLLNQSAYIRWQAETTRGPSVSFARTIGPIIISVYVTCARLFTARLVNTTLLIRINERSLLLLLQKRTMCELHYALTAYLFNPGQGFIANIRYKQLPNTS